MSVHAELNTQQAADLFSVSRPFLIRLTEKGQIPFRKVGTPQPIRFGDRTVSKRNVDQERLPALEDLGAEAKLHGMDR